MAVAIEVFRVNHLQVAHHRTGWLVLLYAGIGKMNIHGWIVDPRLVVKKEHRSYLLGVPPIFSGSADRQEVVVKADISPERVPGITKGGGELVDFS